jgi:hypothetical protein
MNLLAEIYPSVFPWHMNWKSGATHPAVSLWTCMVDHVTPASHGGGNGLDTVRVRPGGRDHVTVTDEFADPRPRHPAEVKKAHPAMPQIMRTEGRDARGRAGSRDRSPEPVAPEAHRHLPLGERDRRVGRVS